MANCTVCKNPGIRKVIDGYLDEKMTGTGISRALGELGLTITPDVINRHRQHFEPPPTRAPGERKRDFAVRIRDRMEAAVEQLAPIEREDGTVYDPVLSREYAPAIGAGLKAQAIIDKREQAAKKESGVDVLRALLTALTGGSRPVALLDDGNTIEGEAVEIATTN